MAKLLKVAYFQNQNFHRLLCFTVIGCCLVSGCGPVTPVQPKVDPTIQSKAPQPETITLGQSSPKANPNSPGTSEEPRPLLPSNIAPPSQPIDPLLNGGRGETENLPPLKTTVSREENEVYLEPTMLNLIILIF